MTDDGPGSTAPPPRRGGSGAAWALALGLAAGGLAWGVGEAVDRLVTAPIVSEFQVSGNRQFALRAATLARKATLTQAAFGGLLGLALGAFGARRRGGPAGRLAVAGLAGLALGAAAGGGSARVLVPWFVRNERPLADDLILPLLTHGGMAAAVGAAAGAAMGIGRAGTASAGLRGALGGLAGGALAAAICEPAAAVFFPLDQTGQPLAAAPAARLLALLLPAASIAALAAVATAPADAAGP